MKTVGVIGGGQLCRMMGEAIKEKNLPLSLIALDPTPECPAHPFLEEQIVGDFKDEEKIRELAKKSDVVTFEIELANSKILKEIEQEKIVAPSPETLHIIQDKGRQKTFLQHHHLPIPPFTLVESEEDIRNAAQSYGYPCLLKARQDSYDGRGNFVLEKEEDIPQARDLFSGRSLLVEKFVPFDKEISVIVARRRNGEVKAFPVGENIHKDNILHTTIVPARINGAVARKAQALAEQTMNIFAGAGVFGIEMFVKGDDILINEIAPRVHNSGHHTIEACPTSQFEQHLRAITDMPLGEVTTQPAIMINILGNPEYVGPYSIEGTVPEHATIHHYGKKDAKPQRKLGHVTILTDNLDEAHTIREGIRIEHRN